MKLYCKGERVIATHADDQDVPTAAYGEDVEIIVVPDDYPLVRAGAPPVEGEPDRRPYMRPELAGAVLAHTVKTECGRRIDAVLRNTVTQLNMTAAALALAREEAAGTISADDQGTLDLLQSGQEWVRSMQSVSRNLIAAGDESYGEDAHWPAAPDGLAQLAGAF